MNWKKVSLRKDYNETLAVINFCTTQTYRIFGELDQLSFLCSSYLVHTLMQTNIEEEEEEEALKEGDKVYSQPTLI